MRAIIVLPVLALGACATPAGQTINCPPLAIYSLQDQNKLAAELLKDGPESQSQIVDYVKLRQACRTP